MQGRPYYPTIVQASSLPESTLAFRGLRSARAGNHGRLHESCFKPIARGTETDRRGSTGRSAKARHPLVSFSALVAKTATKPRSGSGSLLLGSN